MEIYSLTNRNSRKSVGSRQSAACPDRSPSFRAFCGTEPRRFPIIPVAWQIHPARHVYFSLPLALYEHQVADFALAIVEQHAEKITDPRELYLDNLDWKRRCGQALRRCDTLFCLTYPDGTLAAGAHAEAAHAHALGIPVHVITWTLDSEPRLRLGGQIVALKDWHWWRAAIYRPKGRRTGWLARVCRSLLEAADA